ncbi:MAG TPA: class I SAM-dependent methyltransferase [Candidatus Methylomirabilis sp.]|nr:class I SAM-dependent methyltransferase [Candidatus Methylomirabilis sp.]
MAADYALLTKNLCEFYDFADKVVLLVGAGHGQLLDPAVPTKKLIAVDRDLAALQEFQEKVAADQRQTSVEIVHANFEDVTAQADVVYFEFCLHEIADPFAALKRARTLASDVVVFDHSPASEWVFYGAEEEIVRRSSEAMKNFGVRRSISFRTQQRFKSGAELLSKVSRHGPLAIERSQRYANINNFTIPMVCELVLL